MHMFYCQNQEENKFSNTRSPLFICFFLSFLPVNIMSLIFQIACKYNLFGLSNTLFNRERYVLVQCQVILKIIFKMYKKLLIIQKGFKISKVLCADFKEVGSSQISARDVRIKLVKECIARKKPLIDQSPLYQTRAMVLC